MKRIFYYMVCFMLLAGVSVLPAYGSSQPEGSSEVIENFNSVILESMKRSEELGYSGRYELLAPVIRDYFALSFMARTSTGRYWKDMTAQQRDLFLKTYTEWSVASYAGRFTEYGGETFEVLSEEKDDRGIVTVTSRLFRTSGEPVEFNYKMRSIKNEWKILDIHIKGVSQLALTRSQFTSVLKKDGYDTLIQKLREKIRGYTEGEDDGDVSSPVQL